MAPPHVLDTRAALPAAARIQVDDPHLFVLPRPHTEDAYLLRIELNAGGSVRQFTPNGQTGATSTLRPDALHITDLAVPGYALVCSPFHSLFLHVGLATMRDIAEETGIPAPATLGCRPGLVDPVLGSLARALLPALREPHRANALFVEHTLLALYLHVAQHHAGPSLPARRLRIAGLNPVQLGRARELLADSPHATLTDIARECGLSRSHFGKAFRAATGRAPHAWAMDQRVARAQELLSRSDMAVSDVAAQCGFADQSHLTRAFRARMGVPPAQWRRQHRL